MFLSEAAGIVPAMTKPRGNRRGTSTSTFGTGRLGQEHGSRPWVLVVVEQL